MICAFDTKMDNLKRQNPQYAQQLIKTEEYIRNYIASHPVDMKKNPTAVYTIPVVVHIMHTGGAVGSIYNPTDAQITGAIDYINQVFAGTYTGMEEPVEGGGVVNLQLKFELAKRTSGCEYTNGIERVDATGIPNYAANGVNNENSNGCTDLQLKNYSRWDPSQYYNIWVVNKIDGKDGTAGQFVAGYAYFAGAPASLDGTVMLATQMTAGRKTLPHELGHAFNLYHTFQGSNLNTSCPVNNNCNSDGDGVCDTDPITNNVNGSGTYNFQCRSGVNSCTSGNYTRNTESNFMSYTNCYTLFTNGQKLRVQAAMTLPSRASLINSMGAVPCGTTINFSTAGDAQTESTTGSTTACRTYKDYTYQLNIGAAPSASAIVTLHYSGTAIKGLDFDATTNGNFSAPSNDMTFASGTTTPQTFTIRVYDDANVETQESVIVSFTINTSGNAEVGTLHPTFTLNIIDNDVAPVAYNTNSYQVGQLTYIVDNPFSSDNQKQRGQFLYKASELTAAGLIAGPINSMQLFVNTKNTTGSFSDLTIKIGTSATDYLADGSVTLGYGFTTVFNAATFATAAGWNTFNFSTPYTWNGTSNLVVEYCYSASSGTGIDKTGAFSDGGTSTQYNYLFQSAIDCSGNYSSMTGYSTGVKPIVTFGLNIPGTPVETAASQMHTEHLAPGSSDYFYSAGNKVIAKIENVSQELGCVQALIEQAGTSWQAFSTGERSSKVFAVTPTTNGSTANYRMSFYFTSDELDGKDPALLKIAKTSAANVAGANSGNTILVTPDVTMLGTNVVFTGDFTGFSRFFLVDNFVVLPVSLLSFTGELNNNHEGVLKWKTVDQKNLSGFDLERSTDGKVFAAINHTVANTGNGSEYSYNYTDKSISKGLNFYRLKMIDLDGQFSYSEVIKIFNDDQLQFVTLLNNPVNDVIKLSVGSTATLTATMYNGVGAKIAAWQIGDKKGTIELPLTRLKLSAGVYLLYVTDGNKVQTLKILKK